MSNKYHLQERAFLNKKPDMRAYILACVQDTREIDQTLEDQWKWGHIELRLADCVEEISFEFDLSDREERENSLFKARKLAEVLIAFRDALEVEAHDLEAREAVTRLLRAMSAVH
jgi:hypothetical protein